MDTDLKTFPHFTQPCKLKHVNRTHYGIVPFKIPALLSFSTSY